MTHGRRTPTLIVARLIVPLLGLSVALAACSSGEREGPSAAEAKVYMKGLNGRDVALRPGSDANAIYAEAMALKAKGDCAGAIPKLRRVAALGPGYEDAQTALGVCLLETSKSPDFGSDYSEAMTWLLRAGEAGWPEAQGELAGVYALGPTAVRNLDEAGYWLALYRDNPAKARVGFVPMAEDRLAAIQHAVPAAAQAAGEQRAARWERKVWLPPSPPPSPGPTEEAAPGHRMRQRGSMSEP
jgi:TPR repeat protein